MGVADTTTLVAALKHHYTTEEIEDVTYPNNPFFAMLQKEDDLYGDLLVVPVIYGNPAGVSPTFSNAQGQVNPTQIKAFQLTRKFVYGITQVSRELLKASSKAPADAFFKARVNEIDGIMKAVARKIEIMLFQNGVGLMATGDGTSAVGGATWGLLNIQDIVKFEINDVIQTSPAANTDGSNIRAGSLLITKVQRSTGVLTFSGNLNAGIGAIVNTDNIFIAGGATLCISGLAGWNPFVAPTAGDSWFGVDRSVDPNRLAGNIFDASAGNFSLIEGINKTLALINREGGNPNFAFCSPNIYAVLSNLLEGKGHVQIGDKVQVTANIGFSSIMIQGPEREVRIVADRFCQNDKIWFLNMEDWILHTMGGVPELITEDIGSVGMLRTATTDAFEVRVASYLNLANHGPAHSGVMLLPSGL